MINEGDNLMGIYESIGTTITLTVARITDFGYFLTDGEEDVLLHNNEAVHELAVDDEVEVFLYTDSHNRIAATSVLPTITINNYDWAEVTAVEENIGVFLDIGIQKDILLGKDDLPKLKSVWPHVGDLLYITLRVSNNERIFARLATDQIFKTISNKATETDFNKSIAGRIHRTSKVGSWIYTNEGYLGFIHNTERAQEPRLGEKVSGRIIAIHNNGEINVSLLPRIEEVLDDDATQIYNYLQERKGMMPYSDRSHPEDIKKHFQMSKSAFKRALGRLMKQNKIYQDDGWTYIKNRKF